MRPENYTSSLAIKTMSTTLKWVSKVDLVFGNEEFYFSTHKPTLFKLGPGMCPEVEKMRPQNYTSPLTIKTTSTTLKSVSKVELIF
jgi:formaldehyde-activating enzyme involved in methanogenesis